MGTFVVYHVRLGNSITVFLQGPQGYREASARAIEEIPAVYSQMIRSLITGQPMTTHNDTIDRNNVTAAQQAPNRAQADSLWYVRLGYGGATGPVTNIGPGFGFGYRYELDSLAIDLSFLNLLMLRQRRPELERGRCHRVVGQADGPLLSEPDGERRRSTWAAASARASRRWPSRRTAVRGLAACRVRLALGFEFLRASTIRIFVEVDATLPFYWRLLSPVRRRRTDKSYAPSFVVSLGIGWGRVGVVARPRVP